MPRIAPIIMMLFAACSAVPPEAACPGPDCPGCPGPACGPAGKADGWYNDLNPTAGDLILYEVQARSANACHPDVGSPAQRSACAAKPAPVIHYRAEGMTCGDAPALERIKLGTLDDLTENSADFRSGITVRYLRERVGANALWLMPLFPNNDSWALPDACDNLGSPYAVRDYFHASGTLSRACIAAGRDELSAQPCWGNDALERVIAQAHARGVKVLLDVAFNHFGHNYLRYDQARFRPVRDRIAAGESLDGLWDYSASYDADLLHPSLLERVEQLPPEASALRVRCPSLAGDALVRAWNAWRDALDWERGRFVCDAFHEDQSPGFYLGANSWDPSQRVGDNFTNNWRDVKFLYHQETNGAHAHEFVRNREYLFRVLNYWVSRGVDGFRLDHATDWNSGASVNEWKYIIGKVDHYAWRRGQARPVFLFEEFGDQLGINRVADIMTEGYVGDLCGRGGKTKDAGHVESVLGNMGRFGGHTFVMSALETHDEHRLLEGTGFNVWTGAGFWGIGATTWSTPMILMGQELGESWGLGFRRSDFLRSRFDGGSDALVDFYGAMSRARLAGENRALRAPNQQLLRTRTGGRDPRIFAQAKWSGDGNVMFVFHNLWEQNVAQSYYLPPELADQLWLRDWRSYRLVDVLSGQQLGACRRGADLKWDFYVEMGAGTRVQWMRLEACD
jgi:hypothetical protein